MKDDLLVDLTERQKKAEMYITTAAKLVAPVIEKEMDAGYMSVIEQLKIRVIDWPHSTSSAAYSCGRNMLTWPPN